MKRLFVNYFEHPDPWRAAEIRTCMQRNLACGVFDEVVVLAQTDLPDWVPDGAPVRWLDVSGDHRMFKGRPTYALFFAVANEALTHSSDVAVISNSDICYNHTLELLDDFRLDDVCLAISRHEERKGQLRLECSDNSQDTWIFQGRIRPVNWADFPMGMYHCDWRIAWELTHAGYRVLNPCHSIVSSHLHDSPVRNIGGDHIGGPWQASVTQCTLAECGIPPRGAYERGIIGMSLWGTASKYLTGAIRNAELARVLYPGWQLRIYHDDSVPGDVLMKLHCLHVELVRRPESNGASGMFWRFEIADDPAFAWWAVRDADSRLSYRERRAVDSWIESGKGFHVMKDHPWHSPPIMGGAFGGRHGTVSMLTLMADWMARDQYGDDERFLAERVWPAVLEDALIHDSASFPTAREFGRYVLEPVFEDEFWNHEHRMKLLNDEAARARAKG